ncbi:hypothetical protein [Lysobacter brunescens]|uniref:HEPN domain-containing protein n=1 Tax=Lysobacter brunescens TaxID=262323 RepID=A0ABW2Y8E6_9GAMM
MEKWARKISLKPLLKRKGAMTPRKFLEKSLIELEMEAIASSLLPEMIAAQKTARDENGSMRWRDVNYINSTVEFSRAMYFARKISLQELVFLVSHSVEIFRENMRGGNDFQELESISKKIRDVEKSYGLKDDEFWPAGEGPSEYQELNEQWNALEDKLFNESLCALGGPEIAEIVKAGNGQYEKLRERGRRSFFHNNDRQEALADTVKRYEAEARVASAAGAYTAAIVLLGAALEGLLLLRCFRSKTKAIKIARDLPRQIRPSKPEVFEKWTLDALINVCLNAGWLPVIKTADLEVYPAGLAQRLREIRNYVHPGKISVEKPWIELEKRDFDDAEAIYTTLFATVFNKKVIRSVGEKA